MGRRFNEIKDLKKMDKRDALQAVFGDLEKVTYHYFRNCTRNRDEQTQLFEMMLDYKHYARYVERLLKEDENPFPAGFNYIIVELLEKRGRDMEEDVKDAYIKVLGKISKILVKKLVKKLDIPKDAAEEIAAVHPGTVVNKHNAWIFNRALSARLMALQKAYNPVVVATPEGTEGENKTVQETNNIKAFNFADPKLIKNLYELFFGKDTEILVNVYSNLLLDKVEYTRHFTGKQMELWNAITAYLLKAVDRLGFKGASLVIKEYGKRRGLDKDRNRDMERRINLNEIEEDNYPNIFRVLNPDLWKKSKKGKKDKDKKKGKKGKDKKKDKKKRKQSKLSRLQKNESA